MLFSCVVEVEQDMLIVMVVQVGEQNAKNDAVLDVPRSDYCAW